MQMHKKFIRLSIAAGLFTLVASLLGVADPGTYGKETLSWAAQARGQDSVNITVVFPILLISSLLVLRLNSLQGFLIWLGVLIYLMYSYVLYSFFVHF